MCMLSKSKLLAYRQCHKRLWLEVNRPELRQDSAATQASFAVGHEVGEIARKIYDPQGKGILIDPKTEGFDAAFTRTQELLQSAQPIFEACFRASGALALADVLLPVCTGGGKLRWRMIEVKSSASVKEYHHDDAAVQTFIASESGIPLDGIAIAHINNKWVYPGNGDYQGLLVENDLTKEALTRREEVRSWIAEAQRIVAQKREPDIPMGKQCSNPYECGFLAYCQSLKSKARHPIEWLPGRWSNELRKYIETKGVRELQDVPDNLLNDRQRRVKEVSLSGNPYFNEEDAQKALADHKLPAYFLDFETIQFAVPIWKGTRPYQQIPFQFSVHHLSPTGQLTHRDFLDLSGSDPSESLAKALIDACGKEGPIFVYNASFEKTCICELSERFQDMKSPLLALKERIVDLLPVARDHYYHPSQQGSWSIKAVLPALCPKLSYADLEGVQDGSMAMAAYLEAIAPHTSRTRKSEIKQQLLAYCKRDTYALVCLWSIFSGLNFNFGECHDMAHIFTFHDRKRILR